MHKMTTDKFKEKLDNFDWFYMMSEDHSKYKQGNYDQQKLSELADTNPEWKKMYQQKQKEVNLKLM